jgi:glycosyltransferase involved in cell wall biosynthesis
VLTCAPNFPEGELHEGYANRWRAIEVVEGVRVVRVKTFITANEGFFLRTLDYLSFMVMAFATGVFEPRPDVVVATSPHFFSAVAGWVLSVARRRPFVFEVRDLWPASITAVGAMRKSTIIKVLEHVELFLYRRAAAIVSVTESFRNDLVSRGISREKIHVVVNGVDLARYHPRSRDTALADELGLTGKFVVGYLGTHGMAHALPGVLEAAERLKERKNIAFLFAGSGAERSRVERIVFERKLSNVRLVPRQPKERMPALWSVCDVSLVPLRNSPLFAKVIPSKVFESMGMGVPLLMCLPEGEATRIVQATGAGICVPPEDPAALAGAIAELANRPDTVSALRDAAVKAAPRFSRDVGAAEMGRVLEARCPAWRDARSPSPIV